jgi:hypothetical protein
MASSADQSALPAELGCAVQCVRRRPRVERGPAFAQTPIKVLSFIVMLGGWLALGRAVASSPGTLDTAWRTVRVMPALPASLVSIATLPWMIGLVVSESGRRTAAVRTAVGALIAASFHIAFVGNGR